MWSGNSIYMLKSGSFSEKSALLPKYQTNTKGDFYGKLSRCK